MGDVHRLGVLRWESVADMARWLLTHADEYEAAVIVVREDRRQAGDADAQIRTFACPTMPIVEAVGLLAMAQHFYVASVLEGVKE